MKNTIKKRIGQRNTRRIKEINPFKKFKSCPRCGEKELLKIDEQVICMECDWNSVSYFVNAVFEQSDLINYQTQLEEQL